MPPPAERARLRAECLRALDLVAEHQLALFTTAPPPAREALVQRVDAALEGAGRDEAGSGESGGGERAEAGQRRDENEGTRSSTERAAEALRAILRETLARYRDPYASYIDPVAHDAYARRRRGDLVGVGLKFRARAGDHPLVLGALLGGPLDGAELAPGDVLMSADGVDLADLGSRTTRERLSGAAGSRVRLGVRRGKVRLPDVVVERRTVELHYARAEVVSATVADARGLGAEREDVRTDAVGIDASRWIERGEGAVPIGHVRISRFGTDTHERVRALVGALERERGVRGFVLDLRDNPGGSTRAARAVVSLFDALPSVYCERFADGRTRALPRHGEVLTHLPLAVLVNERSQSSAEIVAGALQHAGRARVIGAPTWGKGLIQKVHPLELPLGGAVRTTIATFSTPDGRPLHARGIVPDVYVPSAPHGLFAEEGSLNLSAEARAFRRVLRLEGLAERLSPAEARAFGALPDTQLRVAAASLVG